MPRAPADSTNKKPAAPNAAIATVIHTIRGERVILDADLARIYASKRHVKHLPFAFTEHGAIMAANILNSPQAVQMSVFA